MTQDKIATYAEPIMHATALIYGFGTASAFVEMDVFNNSFLWCWLNPYPWDCEYEGNCERGENAAQLKTWSFYTPLWVLMCAVLGINIWIYRTVHRRELKAQLQHADHHQNHGRNCSRTSNVNTSVVLPAKRLRRESIKLPIRFTFGQNPSRIFSLMGSTCSKNIGEVDSGRRDESCAHSQDVYSIQEGSSVAGGNSVREMVASVRNPSSTLEDRDIEETKKKSRTKESLWLSDLLKSNQTNGSSDKSRSGKSSTGKSGSSSLSGWSFGKFFKSMGFASRTFSMKDDDNITQDDQDHNFRNSIHSIRSVVLPEKLANSLTHNIQRRHQRFSQEVKNKDSIRSADVKFVLATVEDFPSAAKQYAATYHIGARLILYQSIAYVVVFWMIWIFPTINQMKTIRELEHNYGLVVMQAIFEPLQGVFNFFVYRFAHYLRLKELHPRWTTRQLIQRTLRFTFLTNRRDFNEQNSSDSNRKSVVSNFFERNNQSGNAINSARSTESGEVQVSDARSESDESYELPLNDTENDTSSINEDTRTMRRMSSLIGDLMTEFTDDPSMLNENFVEVLGDGLFSTNYGFFSSPKYTQPHPFPIGLSNTSHAKFPTVHEEQSHSESPSTPSNHPRVIPTEKFPCESPIPSFVNPFKKIDASEISGVSGVSGASLDDDTKRDGILPPMDNTSDIEIVSENSLSDSLKK